MDPFCDVLPSPVQDRQPCMYHLPITFGWAPPAEPINHSHTITNIPRWVTELPEWEAQVALHLRDMERTGHQASSQQQPLARYELPDPTGRPMVALSNLKAAMHRAAKTIKEKRVTGKSLGTYHELPMFLIILDHLQKDQWEQSIRKAKRITEIQEMLGGILRPSCRAEAVNVLLKRIATLAENEVLEDRINSTNLRRTPHGVAK